METSLPLNHSNSSNKITEQVTRSVQRGDGMVKVVEVRKRTFGGAAVSKLPHLSIENADLQNLPSFGVFNGPTENSHCKDISPTIKFAAQFCEKWMLRSALILSAFVLVLLVVRAYQIEESINSRIDDAFFGKDLIGDDKRYREIIQNLNNRVEKLQKCCNDKISVMEKFFERMRNGYPLMNSDMRSGNIDWAVANAVSVENIQSMIRRAIQTYDADKTGRYDFALESAGGVVLEERCSETYSDIASWRSKIVSFIGTSSIHRHPQMVIQRRLGPTAGECWPFRGSSGIFTVRLSERINISSVSYEHLSRTMSLNGYMGSAPKDFQIWGYDYEDERSTRRMLGEYQYSVNGSALQQFRVQMTIALVPFNVIELRISSNYGAHYTCLYRLRVHGHTLD